MGLIDLAVSLAKSITEAVIPEVYGVVRHEAWISESGDGTKVYASAVDRRAIIQLGERKRIDQTGRVQTIKAYIAFIEPLEPNGAADRTEPIDARDKLTCPDGTTGVIVDTRGLVNGETALPFYHEVWLGDLSSVATVRPD